MKSSTPLPPQIEDFIGVQLSRYARAGYRVKIHPLDKISKASMTYTGEATAESLEIAIGGPWQEWLGILVHETCHLDQHIECGDSFDIAETALSRISAWLDGKAPSVTLEDFRLVLENESDCESRSVKKIRENNLPIDLQDYTRRANAYLASYPVAFRHRVWIPQPYRNDNLCSLMPDSGVLTASEVLGSSADLPADDEFLRLAPIS